MYTNKILNKFNMTEAKCASMFASRKENNNHQDVSGRDSYREAGCILVYLAAATCPDIAFAVSKAEWVMHRSTEKNWNKIKRIFCYLRSTSNYGLRYTCDSGRLKVLSDVNFAGDKVTRRFMNIVAILLVVQCLGQVKKKRRQSSRQLKPDHCSK
jgi:hypothetical protein